MVYESKGAQRSVQMNKSDTSQHQTCRQCGYDLFGLALETCCPECGTKPASSGIDEKADLAISMGGWRLLRIGETCLHNWAQSLIVWGILLVWWLGPAESIFALFSGTLFAIGAWLLTSDTLPVSSTGANRGRWVVRLSAVAMLMVLSARTIPSVQASVGENVLTLGYRCALTCALSGLYSIFGDQCFFRVHGKRRISETRGLLRWTIGVLIVYAIHAALGIVGWHDDHPLVFSSWKVLEAARVLPGAVLTYLGITLLRSLRSDWIERTNTARSQPVAC